MVILAISLPTPARAQSKPTDTDDAMVIPLHPSTPTSVRLPDEIVYARILQSGEFLSEIVGREVIVRPYRSTPAGTETLFEVETRTLYRKFLLRVVEHADDAVQEIVIAAAAESAPAARPEAKPDAASELPAAPPPEVPSAPSPAPASAPVPAELARAAGAEGEDAAGAEGEGAAAAEKEGTAGAEGEGAAGAADGEGEAAGDDDRDVAGSPRFELSVHAVVALVGTTELDIAGYEPIGARQPHRAFGVRIAGAPPDTWWAVEANVGGEWLAAPTLHEAGESVVVSGPWLRADMGIRARFRRRWSPTAYAGIGLQAQHRDIENVDREDLLQQTLPFGGVLALGLGLEYRAGDLLLGVELHIRQGVPDDYHSVAALLSVGLFLDQGE